MNYRRLWLKNSVADGKCTSQFHASMIILSKLGWGTVSTSAIMCRQVPPQFALGPAWCDTTRYLRSCPSGYKEITFQCQCNMFCRILCDQYLAIWVIALISLKRINAYSRLQWFALLRGKVRRIVRCYYFCFGSSGNIEHNGTLSCSACSVELFNTGALIAFNKCFKGIILYTVSR